ncbi:hypothetical protein [Nocardia sp. NBC_00403]|uniref:hypothetical protein n=1 Tax=Nocardia sp. NBC_00403 TaxID=2975990 RepID=UPI002E1D2199
MLSKSVDIASTVLPAAWWLSAVATSAWAMMPTSRPLSSAGRTIPVIALMWRQVVR